MRDYSGSRKGKVIQVRNLKRVRIVLAADVARGGGGA